MPATGTLYDPARLKALELRLHRLQKDSSERINRAEAKAARAEAKCTALELELVEVSPPPS